MAKNTGADSNATITYIGSNGKQVQVHPDDARLQNTRIYQTVDGKLIAAVIGSAQDRTLEIGQSVQGAAKAQGTYQSQAGELVGAMKSKQQTRVTEDAKAAAVQAAKTAKTSTASQNPQNYKFAGTDATGNAIYTGPAPGQQTTDPSLSGGLTANGGAFGNTYIRTGSGGGSGAINPVTGKEWGSSAPTYEPATGGAVGGDKSLVDRLYDLNDTQVKDLQTKLYQAGYLPAKDLANGLINKTTVDDYSAMLNDVANSQRHGGASDLTPDQYLDKTAAAGAAAGRGSTTTTSHDTQTTVSQTSAVDARAIATQEFQKYLGRGASEKEVAAFTQALQAYEAANPSVSISTTERSNTTGMPVKTTTQNRSREQISPNDAAYNYVHSGAAGDEGNTYMVATDYYSAALQALGLGGHGGPNAPGVVMAEKAQ